MASAAIWDIWMQGSAAAFAVLPGADGTFSGTDGSADTAEEKDLSQRQSDGGSHGDIVTDMKIDKYG